MNWALVFNYVILALYAINTIQFAIRGMQGDACYWFGAFWITATVTFLYKH